MGSDTVTRATVTVLDEPLSLWGGMDPDTGRVIDVHHPQHGFVLTGRVVVMPSGRGSSSSSSVLAESARAGTAPAAIVLGEPDLILSIGSAVAEELYGARVPIIVMPPEGLSTFVDGESIDIAALEAAAAGSRD